jgi:beta-N-acetylhexosaminidase
VQRLPFPVLAGQLVMIGLKADQFVAEQATLRANHIGAIAVMTAPSNPNDGSIARFKVVAGAPGAPLFVATDEEGGTIQRFRSLGTLPSEATVAKTMSPAAATAMIRAHGIKLKDVGIDMVLGPVADVSPTTGTGPLGSRAFSSNPQTVATYTKAYTTGWQGADLIATAKHFPGLGSATGNTDFTPATTPPLTVLKARDLVPYQGLAGTGTAVMVGNQVVPNWSGGPSSLSPSVDDYLRGPLGFANNLVITDSLTAQAITSETPAPEAAVQAIAAGNDIALVVNLPDATNAQGRELAADTATALVAALTHGQLSRTSVEQSVLRKLGAQHVSACTLLADSQ